MTAQTLKTKNQRGFTLIELLVVIGILAILLAITLIAINPARQFGQANDTKRRSDALAILNAIHQYAASNSGNLPGSIASATVSATPVDLSGANFPTLCDELVPDYLPAIPVDPSGNDQAGVEKTDCGAGTWTTGDTGVNGSVYQISKDANNRVTVHASAPYAGPIEVTR
ncbi:MAG TPA: type II secretion system protein [Patescibacteria group bacterium]|nr:type II secretion system protein [Patescibacteria group bacterium]